MAVVSKYRITTLGCRVNHAEAREFHSLLEGRGLIQAAKGERADLEVIHTCSVTNTAAAKSRHALRRALRRQAVDCQNYQDHHTTDPTHHCVQPCILVTGCFTTTNTEEAIRLAGDPNRVITHDSQDGSTMALRFARQLDDWLGRQRPQASIRNPITTSSHREVLPLKVVKPSSPARHIRAELKIQDGCDAHCTFCIIPKIRRTLRSKPISDTVTEAKKLVDLGHKEIVLTGIFIGAYGHETALRKKQSHPGAEPLADLVDAVASIKGLHRLRISSMEPGDATQLLLDAMIANAPVVVPHLHLPLQSGSDAILRKMNRQYSRDQYIQMIDQVNEALTCDQLRPAITTDIICGFPGETEADFQATLDVVNYAKFLHLHIFRYSPRSGTAAARWSDQHLDPAILKQRVRILTDLEEDPTRGLSINYRRQLLHRTVRVILEQPDKQDPQFMTGRCDHYALLHVPTSQRRGTLLDVEVTEVTCSRTLGKAMEPSVNLPIL